MGVFSKKTNSDRVMLQNIVLGINEKKQEVSDDFLDNMTKIYISKRMRIINNTVSGYEQLSKVSLFFKKEAYVNRIIDELIALEPYHIFNYPRPSEYKQELEDNRENFLLQILSRSWKFLRYDSSNPIITPDVNMYFSDVKTVWDDLPESCRELVNDIYTKVYGIGMFETPEPENTEAEPDETDSFSVEEDDSVIEG